jgi:elongation factor Ts
MDISAKQVMELRAASGMPMMQCKKALIEAEGDFEKAMESLRKLGLKTAEKRSGRATSEGRIAVRISDDGKTGTMLLVQCESEPVKNTPKFVEFVEALADLAHKHGISTREALLAQAWEGDEDGSVEDVLRALVGLIGENMQVGKVSRFSIDGDGVVGAYVHMDLKQGALVALKGSAKDLASTAKELCQHVVFAKPAVLKREEISAEEIEKELNFLREQISEDPAMAGKPPQAIEGIVQGRLNKNFFAPKVLSEQGWYREDSKKVSAVMKERGAEVQAFGHFEPGA